MESVVEAFHDKRALAAPKVVAGAGDVIKVTGPIKKQFFTPGESRSIQMSLPKFPKADVLKEGLIAFTPGLITDDHVVSLHRAWPDESSLVDLANETLGENELWDKAEAYMLNLVEPQSLYDRLKVMIFKNEWDEDKAYLTLSIKQMGALFTFLEGNTTLYKVLGMGLAIGNIMNGGTAKGRSDGFDIGIYEKFA